MSKTIFIVDDEAPLRALVRHFLEKEGFTVREAGCALDVFRVIEDDIPDLILLDVSMPEMDGFQLAAILKESPAVRRVPIVFLTASTVHEDKLLAFNLGATDFINKPFQGDELVARINSILRDRQEGLDDQQRARTETVSQLMITMAHYINNSLMAMIGRARITTADDEGLVNDLKETVIRGGERIRTVVDLLREMAHKGRLETTDYIGGMSDSMFDIEEELNRRMREVDRKMDEAQRNGDS